MPSEIRVQPATGAAELRQISNVVSAVSPEARMDVEDLEHWMASNADAVLLLAHMGETAAGAATASRSGRPEFQFTMVRVVPAQRRRGVGSALLAAARRHAIELGLPQLWSRVDASDRGSLEFAWLRGLAETSRELSSVIDLAAGGEPFPAPAGVMVVSLADRPDLIQGAYDAERECLPDVPVPTPMEATSFDVWHEQTLGGPGALPAGSMVALAGDEVIGFAGLRGDAANSGTAEHLLTCVRPPWRGLGVAEAMKSAQIAWARSAGLTRLATSNDSPNAAMLAVNRRLGYRVVAESVIVEGAADVGATRTA
jgi:GNAT superfamily N-acetyltransferase